MTIEFEKEKKGEEEIELNPILPKEEKPLTREDVEEMIRNRNRDYEETIGRVLSGDFRSGNYAPAIEGWRLRADGIIEASGILFNKQVVMTYFESFDGWIIENAPDPTLGGCLITTGASTGTKGSATAEVFYVGVDYDNKNPIFETVAAAKDSTNQTIYFGVGNLHVDDGSEEGFGFKIVNTTLSAISTQSDGATSTETLVTITGITVADENIYRAIMKSKEPNKRIDYYINGKLVATIKSGLPNGTNDLNLMSFSIKNSANENKSLFLRSAVFIQNR